MKTARCRPQFQQDNYTSAPDRGEINLVSATNQWFRKDGKESFGNIDTYRRSYETNLLPGPNRNELWQQLLRIIVAVRAWCSKPARIKRLRINQFH
jgi:hypothetical protein